MLTIQTQDSDALSDVERCGCDCARWAHKAAGICLGIVSAGQLKQMTFEDDLNPVGPYPRRVCAPCADHIVYARHRGGERIGSDGKVAL
jgi:hypothetical protein